MGGNTAWLAAKRRNLGLCCKHFTQLQLPFRWAVSGCELLFEPGHGFGHDAWPNTEGAFDHAFLAEGIACQVKCPTLAFSQSAHDLKSLDSCIGRLHRFKAAHGFDQLFQLAVIRLNNVAQILDLSVLNILWALALFLQFANGLAVASGLFGVDFAGIFLILTATQGLAQKRIAVFIDRPICSRGRNS